MTAGGLPTTLHHRRKAGVCITTPRERTGPPQLHLRRRSLFTSVPQLRFDAILPKQTPDRARFRAFETAASACGGLPAFARQTNHADIVPRCVGLTRRGPPSGPAIARRNRSRSTRTRCRDSPLPPRDPLPSWSPHTSDTGARRQPAWVAIRRSLGMWYPSSCSRYRCTAGSLQHRANAAALISRTDLTNRVVATIGAPYAKRQQDFPRITQPMAASRLRPCALACCVNAAAANFLSGPPESHSIRRTPFHAALPPGTRAHR